MRTTASPQYSNTPIRRRHLRFIALALGAMLFPLCASAEAQQAAKVPRIGWLELSSPNPEVSRLIGIFRQGLRDFGWVENQNIAVEYRYADGKPERLLELATELVRLKVDVIVTNGGNPITAAQKSTKTIPIVMAVVGDPVANGFVASLARPGGNITGLSILSPELSGKRLELLKEVVPGLSRVSVLKEPKSHDQAWKVVWNAAPPLQLKLQPLDWQGPEDLPRLFEAAKKNRAQALLTLPHPLFNRDYRTLIVELAAKNRLPAMYGGTEFLEVGGLMGYGPDISDNFRRAATYVDKILKGAKPADLPVEQPTKFEFVINLKMAKQIGLTIPPNVLARADRVIK
jgi:putative ABC transport system substrate-binding protein